jgi:hypothetical protein
LEIINTGNTMQNSPLQTAGAGDPAFSSAAARSVFQDLKYYEGPAEIAGDVKLNHRYFTYMTEGGIVAGSDFNVMFSIERPASVVWRYFKDFNLWQNSHHSYTKVLGEIYFRDDGRGTFRHHGDPRRSAGASPVPGGESRARASAGGSSADRLERREWRREPRLPRLHVE